RWNHVGGAEDPAGAVRQLQAQRSVGQKQREQQDGPGEDHAEDEMLHALAQLLDRLAHGKSLLVKKRAGPGWGPVIPGIALHGTETEASARAGPARRADEAHEPRSRRR